MLLTINYRGTHTQDLGYLLHKNPARPQAFALPFGKAYVFYPEVSDASTTAALLLDIDPIELARGKAGANEGGLFDYVNDRPYVCSSFMSTALSRVFGTAMSGRSKEKQALADRPLLLTAKVHMLAAADQSKLPAVFEPLGYEVAIETFPNDAQFPCWGQSPYVHLTLSGTVRLAALLQHLYVLLPVFDAQKHYYITEAEIEKLFSHGEGWLKEHPLRAYIASRYLHRRRSLVNQALARLADHPAEPCALTVSETKEPTLNQTRLHAVVREVLASGAKSVIDMGCGEGNLTRLLLEQPQLSKVAAFDVSFVALERAKARLKVAQLSVSLQSKLALFQSSLTYRDERCEGFDCACVVEVIEHLDTAKLATFARVLFGCTKPQTVVITTPNAAYNVQYAGLGKDAFRHADHRFEWNRNQFAAWADAVCETYRYRVVLKEIGEPDDETGAPTQMGVFTRCA